MERTAVGMTFEHYIISDIDSLNLRKSLEGLVSESISKYSIFARPVVMDYPDLAENYLKVIQHPMSLSEVQERLCAESDKPYRYIGEVACDLNLIAANCESFNTEIPELVQRARSFRKFFTKKMIDFASRRGAENATTEKSFLDLVARVFRPGEEASVPKLETVVGSSGRAPSDAEMNQFTRALKRLDEYEYADAFNPLIASVPLAPTDEEVVINFSRDIGGIFWELFEKVTQIAREKMRKKADGAVPDSPTPVIKK